MKKALSLSLTLVLCLGLVACGGKNGGDNTSKDGSDSGKAGSNTSSMKVENSAQPESSESKEEDSHKPVPGSYAYDKDGNIVGTFAEDGSIVFNEGYPHGHASNPTNHLPDVDLSGMSGAASTVENTENVSYSEWTQNFYKKYPIATMNLAGGVEPIDVADRAGWDINGVHITRNDVDQGTIYEEPGILKLDVGDSYALIQVGDPTSDTYMHQFWMDAQENGDQGKSSSDDGCYILDNDDMWIIAAYDWHVILVTGNDGWQDVARCAEWTITEPIH